MTVLSLILYSHFLWTSGLEDLQKDEESEKNETVSAFQDPKQCVTLEKWMNLVRIFALFDSLITIVLPFLVIATMNCLITWKLLAMNKQASYLFGQAGQRDEATTVPNLNLPLILNTPRSSTASAAQLQKSKQLMRSTRILFLITLFFLVFNFPIAICKIRYAYGFLIGPDSSAAVAEFNPWDETFERLTCYMYYLNFATNFMFYL
jgi:hypothetical protein